MFEIIFLSFVQGVMEFLPVSSSSHLIIFAEFLNFENKNLSIDVSLHIGSFFAVLTYFYKDVFNFIHNKDLFLKIFISSLPVMIIGYFLISTDLIENLRNLKIIGWTTLIFGILLYISDRFKLEKSLENDFNYKSAIFIGILQILSLVPGVSRSGITISAARILNYKRFDSAKISFLLSIPTLAAVSFYGIVNVIKSQDLNLSTLNLVSVLSSYFFSLITIKYFLKFIQTFSLKLFVIYRIILGMLILIMSYL